MLNSKNTFASRNRIGTSESIGKPTISPPPTPFLQGIDYRRPPFLVDKKNGLKGILRRQTYKRSASNKHCYSDSNFEPSLSLHLASMQPVGTYKHSTAGEALLFKNVVNGYVHQAVRVEIPELGVEYTDNAYIGKGSFTSDLMKLRYLMLFFCFGIVKIPKVYSTTKKLRICLEMPRPRFSKLCRMARPTSISSFTPIMRLKPMPRLAACSYYLYFH